MLRINRLRVEINTANGMYGFDETFGNGVSFVASFHKNTCGKSSVLAAIYYCLGFEQIIGGVSGVGNKVLTPALKSTIDDNGQPWNVTESGAYLEISNGSQTVTVFRNIRVEGMKNGLVTVYYSTCDAIGDPETLTEDFYVNVQHAATSEKGFHTFLEEFMHLELPLVRTSDGNERKLYLQVIFSSMFIEQKHGWSDIFSGMPVFGIRESKKRVVEYILGLDTLKNEKERDRLSAVKAQFEREWGQLISEIQRIVYSESCNIINFPPRPRVLKDNDYSRIAVLSSSGLMIDQEVDQLRTDYSGLRQLKPLVLDNFDALSDELSATETEILTMEEELRTTYRKLEAVRKTIIRLTSDLEHINADIRNNEDAARLQNFGSIATGDLSVGKCPTCKQAIQDNLLSASTDSGFMSIDDNIKHLKEQKKMLEFSLSSRRNTRDELDRKRQKLESALQTLRRLAQTLRSDLHTTTDTEASEAIMLKRIELTSRIERLSKMQDVVSSLLEKLKELSSQWNSYLDQKRKLPSCAISDSDSEKIRLLRLRFIENLKRYNYSSLSSFEGVNISEETLLPTIDGFDMKYDMKYDSSASDGIRMIWAFTMALLQVSLEKHGNHPGILVFDEPAQQSVISNDMRSFIASAVELGASSQIIIAITLNSEELVSIVESLDPQSYHQITITGKAFKLFDAELEADPEDSVEDAEGQEHLSTELPAITKISDPVSKESVEELHLKEDVPNA